MARRAATAAATKAPARRAPARRATPARGKPARRVSGNAPRPKSRAPARRAPRPAPRRGHTPLALRVARSPLTSTLRARGGAVLDALLQGRGCIALVGVLLVGIVFFNVDLLQRNRQITQLAERSAEVKRENGRLRLELARLASTERIQQAATRRGLVLPPPGDVRYLRAGSRDARRAARTVTSPKSPGELASTPAPAVQPRSTPIAPVTTPPPATKPPATVPAPAPAGPAGGAPATGSPGTGAQTAPPTSAPPPPAQG
jgi:cell division protein FtsL